ncbi:MAG: outer membrane protein [Planctomycetota bacterium]|nr:outer membrane protein [Planctomycetota bacterium]
MRLTSLGNRLALAAALAGVAAPGLGCRRGPYIDPAKVVPHEMGMTAQEDADVKQASFLQDNLSMPLPKMSDPRTTSNPEGEEMWEMTLPEAIKIYLDNSEVIRVIALGAQGIPVGGFEPTPLNTGAGGALGTGTLTTVYDPAVQETQIAQALSVFDASLSATIFWNKNVAPFNNAITAGTFLAGAKFPVVFTQESSNAALTLQKRTATGATLSAAHNIVYNFSNSPTNVFPSAYTTNTQFRFSQPLLGSAPNAFNPNPTPAGLEANRAPIVVQRLQTDVSVWRFKAEVMAGIRSVEQQYWALSQAQVQYWASETAVDLGEQILRREEAKYLVGNGALPNVAEAAEQLERFRLDFVDKTANLITTERQLRNILGMPPTDNRRIIPVTAPTEARLEPNWEASLAQMVTFQPDIVQNQLLVRVAELQLLIARNQLLPVLNLDALYQLNGLGHHLDQAEAVMTGRSIQAINPLLQAQQRAAGLNPQPGRYSDFNTWQVGLTFQMPLGYRGPLANNRSAQYALLRQRAFLQQVVHQTSHSLARFFLEVDSNYKLFKTAGRLKAAAKQRLDAQAAFYENGTITIDRYLDAVNRWATAVAQEADFRTRYNTAIVALEEAKGTLLAYDNIALAEGPWPAKAYTQARDQQAGHNQHPTGGSGPYQPRPINGPAQTDPVAPMFPPNVPPGNTRPPLPAPGGNLGPAPIPAPPTLPALEPNVFGRNFAPGPREPEVKPASSPAPAADELPPLPGS